MIYTYRDIIQKISNDWDMNENDYDTLNWHHINVKSKPTKEELDQQINYYNNIKPLEILREERNKKLLQTDKYSITDWPHPTEEIRQAWITYRQQLRDLPTNTDSIKDIELDEYDELIGVVWPTPPQ